MKEWVFIGAVVALLLAAVAFTEQQPWATVNIIFGNERVSANFAFLLLVLTGALVLIRLLIQLLTLPTYLMQASRKRRAARLREGFDQGVVLYLQGNYEQSQRCFAKASQERSLGYVAWLLVASCALARGNFSAVREGLQAAQRVNVKGDFGVSLIQAEMLLKSGQGEQALAHLEKLLRQQPENRKLADLMVQACELTNRWESLAAAPKLHRLYQHEPSQLRAIKVSVARRLLQLSAKRMNENDLLKQWRGVSHSLQPELFVDYARLLVDVGAPQTAESVLVAAVESGWRRDCIVCYGELERIDVEQRTRRVERWLRDKPNDAALLLCLGKLYRQAGSWERAARCLERSLSLSPQLQTGQELGQVLRHLDLKQRQTSDANEDGFRA